MKITINRKHLRAVALTAGKGDAREYINSVYVEANPGNTRLVSTDGHVLSVYTHDTVNECDGSVNFIMPIYTVNMIKKSGEDVTITVQEGKCTLEDGSMRFNFKPITAEYPQYRHIIPTALSGEASLLDPELLMKFKKAAGIVCNSPNCELYVRHNGDSGSLVLFRSNPEFVGVIMPYRQVPMAEDALRGYLWTLDNV